MQVETDTDVESFDIERDTTAPIGGENVVVDYIMSASVWVPDEDTWDLGPGDVPGDRDDTRRRYLTLEIVGYDERRHKKTGSRVRGEDRRFYLELSAVTVAVLYAFIRATAGLWPLKDGLMITDEGVWGNGEISRTRLKKEKPVDEAPQPKEEV